VKARPPPQPTVERARAVTAGRGPLQPGAGGYSRAPGGYSRAAGGAAAGAARDRDGGARGVWREPPSLSPLSSSLSLPLLLLPLSSPSPPPSLFPFSSSLSLRPLLLPLSLPPARCPVHGAPGPAGLPLTLPPARAHSRSVAAWLCQVSKNACILLDHRHVQQHSPPRDTKPPPLHEATARSRRRLAVLTRDGRAGTRSRTTSC
jgi:hypothetical protein